MSIAIIAVSIIIYPYIPRYYEASALVLVHPTNQDGQPVPDQASDNALSSNAIETYTDLLTSRSLLLSVARMSGVQTQASTFSSLEGTPAGPWLKRFVHDDRADPPSPNALVRSLRANLDIHRFQKSYALRVGFTARSPDAAARMTNVLLSQFIADQVSRRAARQQHYETALKQHVERLKARTAKAEAVVTRYATSSGLINVGTRDAAKQQLATLSEALAKAKSDALSATEHAQMLASLKKGHKIDSSPEVMESPVIQAIKQRVLLLNSTTSHSHLALLVMRNLNVAISGEAQRIFQASQTRAELAREHVRALRNDIDIINARLVAWKQAETHLDDLRNAADVSRTVLKQATARYLEQLDRTAMIRPNVEVIAQAVPPDRPIFPNPKLYAVGTAMLVFLAAAAIAVTPDVRRRQMGRGGRER